MCFALVRRSAVRCIILNFLLLVAIRSSTASRKCSHVTKECVLSRQVDESLWAPSLSQNPFVLDFALSSLRGGAQDSLQQKKRSSKSKRKSTLKSDGNKEQSLNKKRQDKPQTTRENKQEIEKVLKESTAEEALGDAIRDRAEELRRTPLVANIDHSIVSLGWALGASDQRLKSIKNDNVIGDEQDESGGVEADPGAVIVHYFMKSHGGAHAVQSICSLLAVLAGAGSILLSGNSPLSLTLLQRSCLFAMVKHISGLLAGSFLAARAIPEIGLRRARVWMEELAIDPVSQYVFYAASVLFWLSSQSPEAWWRKYPLVPIILVSPILSREVVSTALVVSDVLILWTFSRGENRVWIKRLLTAASGVVNAFMSLLVTPSVWRSADAAERQAILAKLTSRTSLAMEVAVGAIMTVDSLIGATQLLFGGAEVSKRPFFLHVIQRLVCARLYLQFLWTRRRKIRRLAMKMRGGAIQMPFYVLGVLLDPMASLGLEPKENDREDLPRRNWKDMVRIALELDEKS